MLVHTELNNYIRQLTVAEYQKMTQLGILNEDEHLELIDGRLITMLPIGSNHSAIVAKLTHLLNNIIGNNALVWVQNSIYLNKNYMPEPDIVLIKYRNDFYKNCYVRADDILLIIEVSDNSFIYDSEIKMPSYAKFNIPESWIVNLNNQSLIRYYDPVDECYSQIETLETLESINLIALPNILLNLSNLF